MAEKLFGTSGVRKVYGKEFDLDMALNLGKTLGTYLSGGTVLLAQDARTTGRVVSDALSAGLLSAGINVVRAGIIPTPTLAFMTRHGGYDTGAMVTASHNPPEYTGVKFWRKDGMGYSPEQEKRLEEIYYSGKFRVAAWDKIGTESVIENAAEIHIQALLTRCDSALIKSRQFKVVVDPGNGAASVLTPYLMQRLGCRVISINSQLDGHFPGRKSEPDEESLTDLVRFVKETGSAIGIAHDGDSDRVVFVTETGEVIRGDRTIALLAQDVLKHSKTKTTVTTVESSQVLDETVSRAGGKTVRTPVGDIQVALKMNEEGAAFGGEACGVFIFADFNLAPEPFLASCKILELMARTGRGLGNLMSEIPVYPLRKAKLDCRNEKKPKVMAALSKTLPKVLKEVTQVITVDGLGLFTKSGWVLVRPSGTEPVIRITCEAQTDEAVEKLLRDAKLTVERAISVP